MDILSSLNTGGTGLNIAELSETLAKSETEPRKALIDARIDSAEMRLSGYERLRGQAGMLDEALGMMRGLSSRTLASDAGALGVTVTDPEALAPGRSTVAVERLAQAQVLSFGGFASPDAEIGAGAMSVGIGSWSADTPPVFAQGTEAARTLNFAPGSTLSDMARALDALPGVSARVIDLGDGTFSLGVLSETGAANALNFSVAPGADPALAAFDFASGPGAAQVQGAEDALLRLNGIAVTRPSNVVDDLLPGASLSLNGVTSTPATVTAAPNVDGALEVMQSFVEIINATRRMIDTLTARGFGGDGVKGDLAGDSLSEGLMSGIDRVLGRAFGGAGVYLADLGIVTQRDGTYALDADAFTKALRADPAMIDPLVRDSVTGVGVKVSGLPAGAAEAGSYTFERDPATGAATLNGARVFGTEGENGVWSYRVSSGPMRGITIEVEAASSGGTLTFAPGMVGALQSYVTENMASDGGIAQREKALQDSVMDETEALAALEARGEEVRLRYLSRFTEMEKIVTQLNSTGDYLTNLIDAWNSDN
ncbi:flagellar filament capping protein FliD [Roseovarius aquimarinus]|uniref:Flagellar hook-associated protein 2 n=1 Tax=Roseovarius aquimarinus TaxID=1229156 RepID=A0ABW7I576_9RHOB